MRAGTTLRFLLAEHLGSTTTLLRSDGTIAGSQQNYYPFGRTRSGNVVTDKRFTGHQWEQDNLYFMQSRFYDPTVGRFLQPDTIVPDPANPQSLNRYAYVLNNPLRYTDPTGHAGIACPSCALFPPRPAPPVPVPQPVPAAPLPTPPCPESVCPRSSGLGPLLFILQASPITGDLLDACMILFAKDCLTWQDVPEWQQGLAITSLLLPIGFARYGDEGLDAARAAMRARRAADAVFDPTSLRGVKMEQIDEIIPEGWIAGATRSGGGIRYADPARPGNQIRVMPGDPAAVDMLHQGPYAVITMDGKTFRIPLEGNPLNLPDVP